MKLKRIVSKLNKLKQHELAEQVALSSSNPVLSFQRVVNKISYEVPSALRESQYENMAVRIDGDDDEILDGIFDILDTSSKLMNKKADALAKEFRVIISKAIKEIENF